MQLEGNSNLVKLSLQIYFSKDANNPHPLFSDADWILLIYIYIYPTPPLGQDMTKGQFF